MSCQKGKWNFQSSLEAVDVQTEVLETVEDAACAELSVLVVWSLFLLWKVDGRWQI